MKRMLEVGLILNILLFVLQACKNNPSNTETNPIDTIYVIKNNDSTIVYNYPEQRNLVLLGLSIQMIKKDTSVAYYKIEGTVLNNRDTTVSQLAIRISHYSGDSLLVYSCPMTIREVGSDILWLRSKKKGYFSSGDLTPYGNPSGPSVITAYDPNNLKYLRIKIADTLRMKSGLNEIEFFQF